MGIFDTNFILFNLGGLGVSLLELLSVLFGLTCVFLAGRGKSFNYWFGYVYTILLFLLFLQKHLYSSMMLQPISLTIAVFGHYRWTHPEDNEMNADRELKVSVMNNRERIVSLLAIIAFTFVWGIFVKWLGEALPDIFPTPLRPFLDAFVVSMMLTAQYLSSQKKIDCWAAWVIVNTTNIILYISAGLVFMPIVSAAYLVLAFFGFASWRKQWRTDK